VGKRSGPVWGGKKRSKARSSLKGPYRSSGEKGIPSRGRGGTEPSSSPGTVHGWDVGGIIYYDQDWPREGMASAGMATSTMNSCTKELGLSCEGGRPEVGKSRAH